MNKLKYLKIIALFLICSSVFAKDIPMKMIGSEVYYVPVTIGDTTRDFLLDTGSGYSAINKQIFKELSKAGNIKFQGNIIGILANGAKVNFKVYKIKLKIGNCKEIEVENLIMNGMKNSEQTQCL